VRHHAEHVAARVDDAAMLCSEPWDGPYHPAARVAYRNTTWPLCSRRKGRRIGEVASLACAMGPAAPRAPRLRREREVVRSTTSSSTRSETRAMRCDQRAGRSPPRTELEPVADAPDHRLGRRTRRSVPSPARTCDRTGSADSRRRRSRADHAVAAFRSASLCHSTSAPAEHLVDDPAFAVTRPKYNDADLHGACVRSISNGNLHQWLPAACGTSLDPLAASCSLDPRGSPRCTCRLARRRPPEKTSEARPADVMPRVVDHRFRITMTRAIMFFLAWREQLLPPACTPPGTGGGFG